MKELAFLFLLATSLAAEPIVENPTDQPGHPRDEAVAPEPDDERDGFRLTPHLEIRERFEAITNPNLGGPPPDTPGGYLLRRYMPSLTAEWGDDAVLFAQLKSGLANGRAGGARPVDLDRLDLHQAWADLKLGEGERFKIGRQELLFGSGRLIGNREGPNVRLAFDALRLSHQQAGQRIDVFAGRPVSSSPGVFDDHPEKGRSLWGVYAAFNADYLPGRGAMDAYYLGSQGAGFENDNRHSFGLRFYGTAQSWDYNYETIYQTGMSGQQKISAWTVATDTGYTFQDLDLQPRLGLKLDVASGDDHAGDGRLGTFNALYPKGAYFGELALIGPSNLMHVQPSVALHLNEDLKFTLEADFFWRQKLGDGVYGPGLNLLRAPGDSGSRNIGWQWNNTLEWKATANTTLVLCYDRFFPGAFLRETGPAKRIDFFATWVNFKL
ncbi:MAG: alginate export family protein [Candidatus Eremiobacteraeota bacterium]|nr:alginate export family protein [Candidatus Eremiobacteraeota bacterium]